MKYNEDQILENVKEYIYSTYRQHYVGEGGIQAIDVWASLGSAQTTVRDTALKYMMRFGRKEGFNEKDILKAIHYLVLLHYFTFKHNNAPKQEECYAVEDIQTANTTLGMVKGFGGILMNKTPDDPNVAKQREPDWSTDQIDYTKQQIHHDRIKKMLGERQPWVNVNTNKDGDII